MFNGDIARYAVSMTWRFLIIAGVVTALLMSLLPHGNMQELGSDNSNAIMFLMPLSQILSVYLSIYFSLLWMRHSNFKSKLKNKDNILPPLDKGPTE